MRNPVDNKTPASGVQVDAGAAPATFGRAVGSYLKKFQSALGLVLIFLIASIICVRNGQNLFLGADNLLNVVRAVSENGIMAIGMSLVILIGGIDLSVGAILGLVGTGTAYMLVHMGLPMWVIVPAMLAIAAVFGLFNGLISTKLGVQAFIITLASMNMARGLARYWSGGQGIPIQFGTGAGEADPAFSILRERVFQTPGFTGIPVPAICFLAVAVIFAVLLRSTRFGRHIYAVGGNETSAYLCGIKVDRLKILLFMLCSMLASVAGMLHAVQQRQGSPNDGIGYELNAIAAVAIGGTSMAGGKGTVVGTVIGALILGVLDNMLQLNNVDPNLQLILKGVIIVAAVVLQREKKR